jgi:hypothetical protein
MPTDYILFVHGVKTRDKDEFCRLATILLNGIKKSMNNPSRDLKPIFFFWGDQGKNAQARLAEGFRQSEAKWKQFWFRDFRTEQILEFVGDGALYLSRHVGSNVVREFHKQVLKEGLKDANPSQGDRLHFVTHSWGTVILFDILFASRWEDDRLDNDTSTKDIRALIQDIRNALFGLPPVPERGIPLASIHTMGSPLALFTLLTVTGESSNDLSPKLNELIKNLYDLRNNQPLPWRNFAHPGDPLAYPLEGVMPQLLKQGNSDKYVQIEDIINGKGNPFNLGNLLPFTRQRLLPLLSGGEAHGSYWENETVAKTIGSVIQQSM